MDQNHAPSTHSVHQANRQQRERDSGQAGPSNRNGSIRVPQPDEDIVPPVVFGRVSNFRSQWEASQRISAWAHATSESPHMNLPHRSESDHDHSMNQAAGSGQPLNNSGHSDPSDPNAPASRSGQLGDNLGPTPTPIAPEQRNSQPRGQNRQVIFKFIYSILTLSSLPVRPCFS